MSYGVLYIGDARKHAYLKLAIYYVVITDVLAAFVNAKQSDFVELLASSLTL
jgi:hypothetical protein